MPSLNLSPVRLYYRLEGRAGRPRLVLLHPVGADHSLFDAVVPLLLPHYQVLRLDLRGHGGSSTPDGEGYRVEQLADDVLALCDHLGWDRFAVCGVSLGGMTAMQIALQAPRRVQALIACSASPRMPEPPGGGWDARIAAARAHGVAAQAAGMAERMFSPDYQATEPAAIGTFISAFERMDPAGFAGCLAVLRDTDLRDRLAKIDVPALVINGSRDALIPLDVGRSLAQGLARGRHQLLDAGHFPMIEAPGAFVDAVEGFLRAGH